MESPGGELDARVLALPAAEVVAAASLHRIGPAVYRHCAGAGISSPGWQAALGAVARGQSMRHLRALADLAALRDVIDETRAPWAAVKGPVVAEHVWPGANMREFYDLDLIVGRRHFPAVLDSLLRSGCAQVDRNWRLLEKSGRAEIALRGRFGTPIDLHWDVAVTPTLRETFRTDVPGMLGRVQAVTLGTTTGIPTLDAVDTALHLAFHAAQAGANRLMWLADLRFALAQPDFSWADFRHRCVSMGFEVPAALVLARVERSLGFLGPVPPEATAPAQRLWGRVARYRDRRVPFPGLPRDKHLGGAIYSSARRTFLESSFAALHDGVARRLENAALRNRGDVHPLHRDVPDGAARQAYLGAVLG